MAIATGDGVGGGNIFHVWVLDGLGGLVGRKFGSSPVRSDKTDARTEARREKSKLKPLRSVLTGIGEVENCSALRRCSRSFLGGLGGGGRLAVFLVVGLLLRLFRSCEGVLIELFAFSSSNSIVF